MSKKSTSFTFGYLSDTLVASNPVFIHDYNLKRIIFQFFHWTEFGDNLASTDWPIKHVAYAPTRSPANVCC